MKAIINSDSCKGCGLCVNACPKNIIEISNGMLNAKGYHPASINDIEKCTACTACAKMCPDTVIEIY